MAKKPSKMQEKVGKVMHEFKTGTLHTGSKKGPVVKNRKQAIAIAMSEAGMPKKKPAAFKSGGLASRGKGSAYKKGGCA